MGSQHVAGQGKAVFLPRQMLEHVLGHKTGVFLTGQVLGWGDARSGPGMTETNQWKGYGYTGAGRKMREK